MAFCVVLVVTASCITTKPQQTKVSVCDSIPEGVLPPEKDLSKLAPEDLLAAYIKVNTTNPAGCEGKAARFWKKFFDRYGIESEIIPLPFGEDRANIIARVRGSGKGGRPVLLLNHMDVVPAEKSRWTADPFGGEIREGFIYGRGTFDMKATGTYQALMLARAKVQNWDLNRDLIFLGTANEEGPFDPANGVISGGEWMLQHRLRDLRNAEYVITEGGYIPSPGGKPARWEVSPGEKARIELTFTVPPRVTSSSDRIFAMVRAVHKVMTGFVGRLDIPDPGQRVLILKDPLRRANVETTHALTILGGVGKGNTIAAEAVADVTLVNSASSRRSVEPALRRLLPGGVSIAGIQQNGNDLEISLKAAGHAGHASVPPIGGGAAMMIVKSVLTMEQKFGATALRLKRVSVISDDKMPDSAEFAVDFRLLPGESRDKILSNIKSLITGLDIDMRVTDDAVIAEASPIRTGLFSSIVAANKHFYPNMKFRPAVETPILTSTTDAAYFRQRGMIVYGFEPIPLDPEHEHSHGDDERIQVSAMRFATDVTEFYLKDFLTRPVKGIH